MKKIVVIFCVHLFISFYLCAVAVDLIHFVPETAGGIIISFLLCFFLLWLISFIFSKTYFKRIISLYKLSLFFSKEFMRSNVKLTKEILTPGLNLTPAVVKIPLSIKSDFGIMTLSNISNLTPGTLVLGVSEDKKFLYMHTLYLEGGSVEAFKDSVKSGFEKRLMEVLK